MEIEDSNPRCMNTNCKKVWSFEFLFENFPANFHNEKYRERRASILFGHEKSMLPATQPLAAEELRKRNIRQKIVSIQAEISELESKIRIKNAMIFDLGKTFNRTEEKKENIVKEIFVRACPVENCRGFLSTALKCGTCEGYACKHCHLPKNSKYDEDHKCNADTVATIKLLASDTKACPACSTPIYKIQGCDQMYCTQCHTAFSWNKGTIERGTIHNPHYYEWQRSQNRDGRVGDVVCGGVVPLEHLDRALLKTNNKTSVLSAHRLVNHILYVELFPFPNNANPLDNTDLRVSFLLKEITEVQFISKIKQRRIHSHDTKHVYYNNERSFWKYRKRQKQYFESHSFHERTQNIYKYLSTQNQKSIQRCSAIYYRRMAIHCKRRKGRKGRKREECTKNMTKKYEQEQEHTHCYAASPQTQTSNANHKKNHRWLIAKDVDDLGSWVCLLEHVQNLILYFHIIFSLTVTQAKRERRNASIP
jgi:hypothetical protein